MNRNPRASNVLIKRIAIPIVTVCALVALAGCAAGTPVPYTEGQLNAGLGAYLERNAKFATSLGKSDVATTAELNQELNQAKPRVASALRKKASQVDGNDVNLLVETYVVTGAPEVVAYDPNGTESTLVTKENDKLTASEAIKVAKKAVLALAQIKDRFASVNPGKVPSWCVGFAYQRAQYSFDSSDFKELQVVGMGRAAKAAGFDSGASDFEICLSTSRFDSVIKSWGYPPVKEYGSN